MLLSHNIRSAHRWLALVSGLQLLLWLISGAYMVLMEIEYIHGDTLVSERLEYLDTDNVSVELDSLIAQYPNATQIKLIGLEGKPFYQFTTGADSVYVNAQTGLELTPITREQAIVQASRYYQGQGKVMDARLITEHAPAELNPRLLPVWRVDFSDSADPSLYLSANSGILVSKRHDYWRLFDVMWMLHIMDYDTRSDIHNSLLTFMASLALITALAGLALVFISFRASPLARPKKKLSQRELR